MKTDKILYISPESERPIFYSLAEHLWGTGVDIDSDGNSITPDDTNWTELTIINRSNPEQRIDIDPVQIKPLILKIEGKEGLVEKAAGYLASHCKCEVKEHYIDNET